MELSACVNQIPYGLPHHCGYSQMYELLTRDPTLDLGQSQSQSGVTHGPLHFSQALALTLCVFLRRDVTSVLFEISVNMKKCEQVVCQCMFEYL